MSWHREPFHDRIEQGDRSSGWGIAICVSIHWRRRFELADLRITSPFKLSRMTYVDGVT